MQSAPEQLNQQTIHIYWHNWHTISIIKTTSKYCTHMSLLGGDQELPSLFLQATLSTKGHGGPCCLILLSLQAGYTILMAT